jgi:tetratricopeptide (TPR) repeat protein
VKKKKTRPLPSTDDRLLPHPRADLWSSAWPYLVLFALATGVYLNALGNGFVSDDNYQLLHNPLVRDWSRLPDIFGHGVWWGFAQGSAANYYRPVQMLVYLGIHSVFGFNAAMFHLLMVLIHAANTLLVFRIARRLLKTRDGALAAAALFAVHPIHDEAVVWIAALPDLLLTLIVLSAFLLFLRWNATPRGCRIAVLAGLFLVALLTKETGIMLLPLLVAYDFVSAWKSRAFYAWLFVVSAVAFGLYGVLRIHALGGIAPASGRFYDLHGLGFLLTVVVTLGQYLQALLLPLNLCFFHTFTATTSITPRAILSLIAVLAVVAAILRLRRPQPVAAYGLLWVLLTLLPALNVNGIGESVFAERYLYLPSVGFVLAAALAWESLKVQSVAWAGLVAIVAASSYEIVARNADWHDDIRLYTVTARQSPGAAAVEGYLGLSYYARGEWDQALQHDVAAMKLQPDRAVYHLNLGNVYAQTQRQNDAEEEFRQAIALQPDYAEAYSNLGLLLESRDKAQASVLEEKALALRPTYAEPMKALARLKIQAGDYPSGIALLQRVVASDPYEPGPYIDLGVACNEAKLWQQAVAAFRRAIEVGPTDPDIYAAHYNLGIAYTYLDSPEAALMEFHKALELKPDFQEARQILERIEKAQ